MSKSKFTTYGRLAMELDTTPVTRDVVSILNWIEDGELLYIDEERWDAFKARFNLTVNEPGKLVDQATADAIRQAAAQDPGEEAPLTVQDHLDELTAAAMTKMHKAVMTAIGAAMSGMPSSGDLPDAFVLLPDAIMGRCSPIVQELAQDAYRLDREPQE